MAIHVSAVRAQTPPPVSAPATAPERPAPNTEKPDATAESEKVSETHHTLTLDGKEIHYTARAGILVLKTEEGKPRANVFYVAYTLDGVADQSRRPIAFCFNGGPGAASVWLHIGAFGPKRVLLNVDGTSGPPPYRLASNENSLLDATDLVFIDPVSTGYSRPAAGESAAQFHGVDEDKAAMGDFIRFYVTRNNRWISPKLLIGESYGTTRAAVLANYLQDRFGMYLNGVVLIGTVLNFETLSFSSDLSYISYLPSYTANAWYHKKLAPDLQKDLAAALRESREFAEGDYAEALTKGSSLTKEERSKVLRELSRLTGLDEDIIDRANLRIGLELFRARLLWKERRTIGRYDGRYTMAAEDPVGDRVAADPSYEAVKGVFAGTINPYLREELKFESDLSYEILAGIGWNWSPYNQDRSTNVSSELKGAIVSNPHLKILVAAGYFDLATPFFAAEYTFDHLNLDAAQRKNVTMTHYESGHMVYLNKPSLAQLRGDVERFIRSTTPE